MGWDFSAIGCGKIFDSSVEAGMRLPAFEQGEELLDERVYRFSRSGHAGLDASSLMLGA
jgi:hypothetical protein